jgi:indole-3-glycerol phosphate synthase
MSADFLSRMRQASHARVARARSLEPEAELLRRARALPKPPPLTLSGFDIIAELKLRSPAAGVLAATGFNRNAQVAAYARAGAAAVSVLTEPDEFKGDLEHLREAVAQLYGTGCPVMRKDFLTDPYQIIEARAAGAGGVLVIVGLVDDAALDALLGCAADLGLFVLLEAFTAEDLARIAALRSAAAGASKARAPVLVGINCRNLRDLSVDFARFAALAPHLPPHLPCVAESGIDGVASVRAVAALGFRLALVGSALMRNRDPATALAELLAAGRGAVTGGGA